MGIDIRVVNPGFVKTRLTDRNDFEMPFLLEPEEAAKEILDGLLKSKRFDINFPRALTWPLRLLRMLPDQLFFGVIKRKVLRHE
jgi:short-subunit dehydrogenase